MLPLHAHPRILTLSSTIIRLDDCFLSWGRGVVTRGGVQHVTPTRARFSLDRAVVTVTQDRQALGLEDRG